MISQKMSLAMYEYSYFLVSEGIKELNHKKSMLFPPGGSNPANWILGHIMASRCNVLAMLKTDPPWDFSRCSPYIPDSKPLSPGDEVEDFETMKKAFENTQEHLLGAIRKLTAAELEEKNGENSLGESLAGYGIHEAFHAGELAVISNLLQS